MYSSFCKCDYSESMSIEFHAFFFRAYSLGFSNFCIVKENVFFVHLSEKFHCEFQSGRDQLL